MRRYSRPLLLSFAVLLGLLLVIAMALLLKKPVPVADDEDDDGQPTADAAANAAQGRRFDPTFGSLAALVPQGGSAPVLFQGAAGSGVADASGSASGHGDQYRDLSWLRAQAGDAYTLQVLAAHSEDSARQFIAGQKDPEQFRYFQTVEAGQSWFVVVYGNYGSRVQAVGTAAELDFGQATRPFAKAFGDYVADINQVVAAPAAGSASPAEPAPVPAVAP